MELQTDIRIDADAEIVVHDDHARLILGVAHRLIGFCGTRTGRLKARNLSSAQFLILENFHIHYSVILLILLELC